MIIVSFAKNVNWLTGVVGKVKSIVTFYAKTVGIISIAVLNLT